MIAQSCPFDDERKEQCKEEEDGAEGTEPTKKKKSEVNPNESEESEDDSSGSSSSSSCSTGSKSMAKKDGAAKVKKASEKSQMSDPLADDEDRMYEVNMDESNASSSYDGQSQL